MKTKKLGLIGKVLTHSFSKKYFTDKFCQESIDGWEYDLYPLANIEEFEKLIETQAELVGLNVTIPYKEVVIPYLDQIEDECLAIGAVNVIKRTEHGLEGFNTDVYGFEMSLLKWLAGDTNLNALILGTGGASKAIKYALTANNIGFLQVSRSKGKADMTYDDLDNLSMSNHRLIINCTPLGTSPNVELCPDIPYDALTEFHYLYDLVYNPEQTTFMKNGLINGARVKNGYEMLVGQAEKAWQIWNS